MKMHRAAYSSGFLVAALVAALPVAAQGRTLFEWSGRVDREVQLVMRGGDLSRRGRIAILDRVGGDRARVVSALPNEDGYVSVRLEQGRGQVDVIQQPSSNNDYTAIVRIQDPTSGAGDYRLAAYWQPEDNGRGNGGWGNGRDGSGRDDGSWGRGGRDDDDDYDRGDRHDRGDRGHRGRGNGRGNGRWGNNGRGNGNGDYGNGGALHWSGNVDDVVQVRIQGRRVETVTLRGEGTRTVRSQVTGRGLNDNARLDVRQLQGRGDVRVVQQPTARNGYTAVIEIRDPRGGYGYYDFDVIW